MLEKNEKKLKQKENRKTWIGLYPRRTKTKKEAQESERKKHKGKIEE